jgi:hypothetical protein
MTDSTIAAGVIHDASNRAGGRLPFSFLADNGKEFGLVAITEVGPIARGPHTDSCLARVVRTGNVVDRKGLVRARLEFARDLGDQAGTLIFDADRIGGRVPATVFDLQAA